MLKDLMKLRKGKLKIPSVKIGKLVRYDLKDMDRYMGELPRRALK